MVSTGPLTVHLSSVQVRLSIHLLFLSIYRQYRSFFCLSTTSTDPFSLFIVSTGPCSVHLSSLQVLRLPSHRLHPSFCPSILIHVLQCIHHQYRSLFCHLHPAALIRSFLCVSIVSTGPSSVPLSPASAFCPSVKQVLVTVSERGSGEPHLLYRSWPQHSARWCALRSAISLSTTVSVSR